MKTFMLLLVLFFYSCNKDSNTSNKQIVWVHVKPSNAIVNMSNFAYTGIVFNFVLSKDSLQQEYIYLPNKLNVVVGFANFTIPYSLPSYMAKSTLPTTLLGKDSTSFLPCKITSVSYSDGNYTFKY